MNNQDKTNVELIKELQELQQAYNSLKVLFDQNAMGISGLINLEILPTIIDFPQGKASVENSEQRFHGLLTNLEVGVVVHAPDSSIIMCNSRASALLGISEDILKGKLCTDPEWQFVKKPNVPLTVDEYPVSRIQASRQPIQNQLLGIFRPQSDDLVWVLVNGFPFFDQQGEISEILISFIDITERKHTEEELQIKDWVIESATSAIVTLDLKGNLNYMNLSFLKLWGYSSSSEIIGKPIMEFWQKNSKSDEFMNAVYTNGEWNGELIGVSKIGVSFDVLAMLSLVVNDDGQPICMQSSFLDITQRKQTENELRRLNKAIEQSPVTVVITNMDGNIEYANPKFIETTGYTMDEVQGKNSSILQSGTQTNEFYEGLWKTILSGNNWTGEFQNRKKNGDLLWESAVISPIRNSNGDISSFIAIKEDITEKKKMMEDLIVAKEMAEKSDRLKSAFLANMSHEIRTPMNGILGFSELLKEPNLTGEEQQEYIKIIEKSGARMLNIINDIVDISKIEAGLMLLDMKESNLNEQIEYIYTLFKPEVEGKGMKLFFKNGLPFKKAILKTDRGKIYAILTNLVKNAIKYTQTGSIEIGYKHNSSRSQNGREDNPDELEFYVKDTGIGVRPENKNIIFERFRQGSESISREYEGAGLGLSISKAYIEMLGGKIWVENNVDIKSIGSQQNEKVYNDHSGNDENKAVGSTFFFTIPYVTDPDNRVLIKNSVSLGGANIPVEPEILSLKILIVEDDETSEMLLSRAVRMFSKEILHARTGYEAVEACQKNPDIDLVLMDIQMPQMSGYEATRQIRHFNKNVFIVAQTAYGLSRDRDKAIEAGCNNYISKPIDIAELLTLIKRHFKKTNNQPAAN
jgi:PAS domain S-box-containing protein